MGLGTKGARDAGLKCNNKVSKTAIVLMMLQDAVVMTIPVHMIHYYKVDLGRCRQVDGSVTDLENTKIRDVVSTCNSVRTSSLPGGRKIPRAKTSVTVPVFQAGTA